MRIVQDKKFNCLSLKNNVVLYSICFFIPVIIMAGCLIMSGIYPFGDKSILRMDLIHQYAPFLSLFRDKLKNGESLLYSFDIGMGINFLALYVYYLASPLNLILVFVSGKFLIEAITALILIKVGACGLFMGVYLKKHAEHAVIPVILFSAAYALSGYICAYSWNIMWLDAIAVFPVLLYAMERMLKTGKGGLYTFLLWYCIFTNYYISIMICIFLCIYFIMYNIQDLPAGDSIFYKRLMVFIWYSLLAGGLCTVLLIPEYKALQYTTSEFGRAIPESLMTASDMNTLNEGTPQEYFSILEILARHLPFTESELLLDNWPNIYCGAAVFLFIPLYLISPKIKFREKVIYSAACLFLLASFSIDILNFIWHGFHYPNSLPARQSFIYIFLVCFMCFRACSDLSWVTIKHLVLAYFSAMLFLLVCQVTVGDGGEKIPYYAYYAGMAVVSAYALVIRAGILKQAPACVLKGVLACIMLFELALNMKETGMDLSERNTYTEDREDIQDLIDGIEAGLSCHRVKREEPLAMRDDGAWNGYPSVPLFSSMADAGVTVFLDKLGCEASVNYYSLNGSTPLVDMLLGVKYELMENEQQPDRDQQLIGESENIKLYENAFTLPAAFVLPASIQDGGWLEESNPVDAQNAFSHALGCENVLRLMEGCGSENKMEYEAKIPQDGHYYIKIGNPRVEDVSLKIGNEEERLLSRINQGYLIDLGWIMKGEIVTLQSETAEEKPEAELYLFDYDAAADIYEELSGGAIEITEWTDGHFEGEITVTEEMLSQDGRTALFFSIPYDKGWTIRVDGIEVPAEEIFDAFLSIRLEPGVHTIEADYMPEGLKEGIILAGISAGLFGATILYGKRRKKNADITANHPA